MASLIRAYFSLLPILSELSVVLAQSCDIQFDGRVSAGSAVADFDATNNLFSPDNVFGQGWDFIPPSMVRLTLDSGLKFSQLLELPAVTPSLVR